MIVDVAWLSAIETLSLESSSSTTPSELSNKRAAGATKIIQIEFWLTTKVIKVAQALLMLQENLMTWDSVAADLAMLFHWANNVASTVSTAMH